MFESIKILIGLIWVHSIHTLDKMDSHLKKFMTIACIGLFY